MKEDKLGEAIEAYDKLQEAFAIELKMPKPTPWREQIEIWVDLAWERNR